MARILIVEDVAELAEELRSAAPEGHELVSIASKEGAVEYLKEISVDLVVTALVLETGDYQDGLTVVRTSRQTSSTCKAIVVSSFSTPETCLEAIRAGAFDYIERNSPGIDFVGFLRWRMSIALGCHDGHGAAARGA